MKRRWVLALTALGVVVAGGATLARSAFRKLKGPPMPLCQLAAPPKSRLFAAPTQLSSPTSPGARRYDIEPAVALLPDGALAIAWNVRDPIWSASSGLVTARLDRDGHLEAKVLPTTRTEAFDAWMTVADDGEAHLVWLAHDGGRPEARMQIAHATSRDARSWTIREPSHLQADCPETAKGCLDKPMVVPTTAGIVTLYSTNTELRAVTPGARSSARVAGGANASVARTPDDVLHLVVVEDKEASAATEEEGPEGAWGSAQITVSYVRSDDRGQSWKRISSPAAEGEPVPFFFSNPQIAVDAARGFTYVAYPTGTPEGAWIIRLATSSDGGRTWKRLTVNDDAPCANHMAPQLALDPSTGTVHLIWLENRTGTGALVAAQCEPGGQRCGPNETVSGGFASYSFERHLPAWLSEYGALVVDDERRTLHAVWTQPVEENGSATSRIFCARAQLPPRPE